MSAYFPAVIWLLSGGVCLAIAKRRQLKSTAVRQMLVALAGPLAIPYFLTAKRDPR